MGALAAVVLALVAATGQRHNIGGRREDGECIHNLRILGGDYQFFGADHGAQLTAVSTNLGGVREYVGDPANTYVLFRAMVAACLQTPPDRPMDLLVCPMDWRGAAPLESVRNTNISYFLSINTPGENGRWILAGSRNISLGPEVQSGSATRRQAGWDAFKGLHRTYGYVLLMDGSVSLVNSLALSRMFSESGNLTNQLAIP